MATISEWMRSTTLNWLFGPEGAQLAPAERQRYERYSELLAYQRGEHRQQLKTKMGQANDNLTVNWCGVVIERGISMLFGDGISFDLPGEGDETPEDVLIQAVMAANKQPILLHRLGQFGGVLGTCYVKIVPERAGPDGKLPKLVALNPAYMEIDTLPDDKDEPVRYTQRYTLKERGEDVAHKIVTERNREVALQENGQYVETGEYADAWTETHYVLSRATGGQWRELSVTDWPYPFAPVVHWQNLPDAFSCYGRSDIDDVLPIQDRYNFNAGNISKIIRNHAHPKQYVKGAGTSGVISWAPDEVLGFPATAEVGVVEMVSDLASSQDFLSNLREALFTVTRTTDPATIKDKAGALTNVGLKLMFKDELHKTYTKRELYGDGLLEVVRRLLVLAGAANTEPGEIVWPEPLPVNEVEQTTALKVDIETGLVSKQTASGERGYDWETEQERMEAEQQAADNVGAGLLRAFGQGGGASLFGQGNGQVNDQTPA